MIEVMTLQSQNRLQIIDTQIRVLEIWKWHKSQITNVIKPERQILRCKEGQSMKNRTAGEDKPLKKDCVGPRMIMWKIRDLNTRIQRYTNRRLMLMKTSWQR